VWFGAALVPGVMISGFLAALVFSVALALINAFFGIFRDEK
jgi:hypothetical protein